MYGNVNRKKRKDGTAYKDYFYYVCKHRKLVDDEIRKLPTQELLLDLNGNPLATSAKTWREIDPKTGDKFRVAHCHYLEREDGSRDYLTSMDLIPDGRPAMSL